MISVQCPVLTYRKEELAEPSSVTALRRSRWFHLSIDLCSPGTSFLFMALFLKGWRLRSISSTAPPYQLLPPRLVISSACFQQGCLPCALPCERFFPASGCLPPFSVYSHALFALLLWTSKQHTFLPRRSLWPKNMKNNTRSVRLFEEYKFTYSISWNFSLA